MKRIYIWGTGYESQQCIANINMEKCEVIGYIETNPGKQIWKDKAVYTGEDLPQIDYDYIIIANIYYNEILNNIREKKLADEKKIINWIKIKDCIFSYSEEVWMLFSDEFLNDNLYLFNFNKGRSYNYLENSLSGYDRLFIYDLRLIDGEFDIAALIDEMLKNLNDSKTGMLFIPNEDLMDEIWYHNLLCVLDKNAFVVWKDLEGTADYIINNSEKFSFSRFNALKFERMQKRTVKKGRYMLLDTECMYEKNKDVIKNSRNIKIYKVRSDRIGEEIRCLNKIFRKDFQESTFELYIPVDLNQKPFEGVNTCFNEIMGRKINLLKNKDEYYLWIQSIFNDFEKYEYCGSVDAFDAGNILAEMNCPLIDFMDEELEAGKKLIKDNLGIKGDYVCLFTRDEEYLKRIIPHVDVSSNNYRDASFDIMNSAIDYFNSCGIQTIRMGQITEQREMYGGCIDFANNGYDEFIDLILHRFSKFFMGSCAGISEISSIFGKPVIHLAPYYPLIECNELRQKEDLCIFNRIYDVSEGRELSFIEMFDAIYEMQTKYHYSGDYLSQHELKLIPFSQEDVLDVAVEMNDKLDGVWQDSGEDIEIRNEFNQELKSFIKKHDIDISYIVPMPAAASYLRRYKYLLC